jgi:hypothetical protein
MLDPNDREVSARLARLAELADDPEDADGGVSLGGELEDELVDVLGDEPDVEPQRSNQPSGEGGAEAVELREVEDDTFVGSEITLGDGEQTPDVLATTTLADIYAAQGYRKKAIKIYRELLQAAPGNRDVREKLRALGVDVAAEFPEPAAPARPAERATTSERTGGAPGQPASNERSATHFRRWLENLRR